MMNVFRTTALVLFFSVMLPVGAVAQTLSAIDSVGNNRVDKATILIQVQSKVGQSLQAAQVAADIKSIYRTGFFEQVSAKVEKRPVGDVLVFFVKERPAIHKILFTGNEEIKESTLQEEMPLGTRRFLDERRIREAIKRGIAYYKSKGFYGTTIEYKIKEVDQYQVDVEFAISEGKEKVVREINFEGNNFFEADDLEEVITLETYSWWSSWITGAGNVNEGQLEEDKRRLGQEYLKSGFVDVKIADPVVEEKEDKLVVVFRIAEGERYKVNQLSATGDLFKDDVQTTLEGIGLKEKEFFNAEQMQKDVVTISEKFTDIGYAFTNVEPRTFIKKEDKTIDITFAISKGGLVHIDRIDIAGNKKTQDNVVRRSLVVQEQDMYSSSKIKRSQELVERLGYFEEVSVTTTPSQKQDMINLAVAVREGSTGSFSAGAGVSSEDGFIITLKLAENNLFGTGNNVNFDANTGSRRENYVIAFENPRVNDSYWSTSVSALSVQREFDDFDRKQTGGSLSVGYPLWFLGDKVFEDVRFSLTYELLNINIDAVDEDAPQLIQDEKGKSLASSIGPRLVRNTINNPLDPTTGSRQSIETEFAGLGGDEKFWLVNLANTFYYPLYDFSFGPVVFSQRTRYGYGDTFNNETLPLYRRFFPGGINSVRGFDDRQLGPKDEQGNEYGASQEVVMNFEFILPLVPSAGLKFVTFYDMGQGFDDNQNLDFNDLRQSVGWGIRWRTPLAPIRIEVGYPLDREPGEGSAEVHFSFGAPL